MKTYQCLVTLMITICSISSLQADESDVMFFKGTVEAAKEKARKESKLYFIEFHAKWCDPCKWMDEFTFSNPTLSGYIDKNYVPVKVDVENLDGFVWKQKFKVQYLPTIVVLDANGAMLGKYEKSMGATELMRILQNHRSSATDMHESVAESMAFTKPETKIPGKVNAAKPVFINVHREPGLPKASEVNNKPAPNKVDPMKVNIPTKSTNSKPMSTGGEPVTNSAEQFRVQIGVYTDPVNVASEVSKLKKSFTQIVQVFNNKNKETNMVSYRITLGKFGTKEEAMQFVQVLKEKGMNGVIKHVSDLEQKM